MKIFIALCILLTAFTGSAYAEDASVRGIIGDSENLPPPTLEQYEESMAIADSCKAYDFTRVRYDCDCVGMKFLELRREKGDEADAFWLREDAQKACPNTAEMAGLMYSRCLHWAPMQRGEGYEEFCSCYGSQFAKIYAMNPSENQLVVENQMSAALGKCNVNSVNERKQELRSLVDKLKQEGTYDLLFPSPAK